MIKREESLLDSIKKAFSAFSYEYSGEMLSSHSKNQVLSGISNDKSARDKLARAKLVKDNSSSVLNKSTNSKMINPAYDRLGNKPKILTKNR
ncbi:MAG: hypothetical protein OQK46_03275 [Gammaproteobacteria bacterium]|nr:hypothetical protein [Gammaproteobacteria bacterium]